MTLNKEINIIGSGGHSRPVLEVLEEHFGKKKKNIYDINYKKRKKIEKILGNKVIGSLKNFFETKREIAYLAIGNNNKREKVYNALKLKKIKMPNLISKTTILSKYLKIGEGNFINKNSFIGTEVEIKNNNIINTGAVIEHQCKLGSNIHIGPKVILGGHVEIEDNVLIGLGSKVINNIKICKNCIVGAGSVVTKNLKIPGTYVGIPARIVKKN